MDYQALLPDMQYQYQCQGIGSVIAQMREVVVDLGSQDDPQLQVIGASLRSGIQAIDEAVRCVVAADACTTAAGAVPFWEPFTTVAGQIADGRWIASRP